MLDFRDQTFGIELEFTGITRKKAAGAIAMTIRGDYKYDHRGGVYDRRIITAQDGRQWTICRDGSVSGSTYEHGGEFVTPICRYEDIEKVQDCVRALRKAGAQVDSTCGLHIHVGADKHTAKSLRNLVYTFKAKQNLIYKAAGAEDRMTNHFSKVIGDDLINNLKKIRDLDMNSLGDTWYRTYDAESDRNAHYNDSRYHGINLHSVWYHGTVEFRLFHATLHAGEVRAYINLILAMSAAAINSKRASAEVLDNGNDKYAMRCWLLRLGFIGDDYKNIRKHLLKRLEGNAAWRNDPETYDSYNNRNNRQTA